MVPDQNLSVSFKSSRQVSVVLGAVGRLQDNGESRGGGGFGGDGNFVSRRYGRLEFAPPLEEGEDHRSWRKRPSFLFLIYFLLKDELRTKEL